MLGKKTTPEYPQTTVIFAVRPVHKTRVVTARIGQDRKEVGSGRRAVEPGVVYPRMKPARPALLGCVRGGNHAVSFLCLRLSVCYWASDKSSLSAENAAWHATGFRGRWT